MDNDLYKTTVARVGIITIIWNFILSLIKFIGGILANSSSLISDGIHSFSDVLSTIVVMIGAKLSRKKPDNDHPFGHERLESIASFLLAILLGGTAIGLGYNGIISIINQIKGYEEKYINNLLYLAFFFAIGSIVIKAWMYFYTIHAANKINSTGLKADAFHHLSDSLSSIASALGIIGLIIGGVWTILDSIASIIIALFIIKVSIDISKEAINQVIDHSAPRKFQEDILNIVKQNHNVIRINSLKTRMFGNMFYVELEIAIDDNLTVIEGHNIAKAIHDSVELKHKNIKHCMIHIDPASEQPEE